jgi:hypothetical protein
LIHLVFDLGSLAVAGTRGPAFFTMTNLVSTRTPEELGSQ